MQTLISIKEVTDKTAKEEITLNIMGSLPEWFSPPESFPEKAALHREFPFFGAFDGDRCVGFAALKIHNEYTAEVYNLGILKEYHRRGGGHGLIAACEKYCRKGGIKFLTVKTLDGSAEYAPYEGTRAFYKKEGFYPLEVFPDHWDRDNPCLFMAKSLEAVGE